MAAMTEWLNDGLGQGKHIPSQKPGKDALFLPFPSNKGVQRGLHLQPTLSGVAAHQVSGAAELDAHLSKGGDRPPKSPAGAGAGRS